MSDYSNAYFNLVDVYKTLQTHGLLDLKRIHGNTDNEDTIGDLIEDVFQNIFANDLPTILK